MTRHQQALGGTSGLARTLALPGENKPIRFPSFPALERTAVMAFNNSLVVTPATADSDTSKIAVVRQAAYPLWADVSTTYGAIYEYTALGDAGWRNQVHPNMGGAFSAGPNGRTVGVFIGNAGFTGVWADPPLQYPIMALDDKNGVAPWIYVPRGAKMLIFYYYTGTPNGTETPVIDYELWVGPGEAKTEAFTSATPISGVNGNVQLVLAATGGDRWLRLNQYGTSTPNSTLKMSTYVQVGVYTGNASIVGTGITLSSPVAATMFMPIANLPDYKVSKVPWSSTRVTAVSLLATNTTKALDKEGTVLWGRIDPQQYDLFSVTSSHIAALHPAEKAFLPLEEGCYTYTMPSTDIMEFTDYNHYLENDNVPVYRLDHVGMMNVGFFQDSDPATPTMLACNLDVHLEFRTTSALFQIGMCAMPVETLHQAQITLMKIGFFFRNENHESMIQRGLRAFARASPLLEVFGPVGKGLAAAARTAQILAQPGPHKPTPTYLHVQTKPSGKARREGQKKGAKPPPKAGKKKKGGLQMYLDARGRQ